jgi:hypothetical protein
MSCQNEIGVTRGGNEFSRILDGELSGGTDPLRPVSYWKIRFNNGNVAIITEKPVLD